MDLSLIPAAGVGVQGTPPVAKTLDQTVQREIPQLGDGVDSQIVERLTAGGPDPVETADRERGQERLDL